MLDFIKRLFDGLQGFKEFDVTNMYFKTKDFPIAPRGIDDIFHHHLKVLNLTRELDMFEIKKISKIINKSCRGGI